MNDIIDIKQHKFLKLFLPEQLRLERYCLSLTGNQEDAKDLVSEAILQAYLRLEFLREESKFPNYIFRIAKRLYLKKIRRNVFNYSKHNIQVVDTSPDPSNLLDVKIMYEALSKLPLKLKQAVILYEISGFAMSEIAEMENCSLSAVKVRVMRGRNKLRGLLKDLPYETDKVVIGNKLIKNQ